VKLGDSDVEVVDHRGDPIVNWAGSKRAPGIIDRVVIHSSAAIFDRSNWQTNSDKWLDPDTIERQWREEGSGKEDGPDKAVLLPAVPVQNRGVGPHFLIERNGSIRMYADCGLVTRHAGAYNQRSIGIELVGFDADDSTLEKFKKEFTKVLAREVNKDMLLYTDKQYIALVGLLKALRKQFPQLTAIRHSDIWARAATVQEGPVALYKDRVAATMAAKWANDLSRRVLVESTGSPPLPDDIRLLHPGTFGGAGKYLWKAGTSHVYQRSRGALWLLEEQGRTGARLTLDGLPMADAFANRGEVLFVTQQGDVERVFCSKDWGTTYYADLGACVVRRGWEQRKYDPGRALDIGRIRVDGLAWVVKHGETEAALPALPAVPGN
jgi:hypothetical protein